MSERPRLASIDLVNWLGLFTKGANPIVKDNQLRVADNCDMFTEYGSISKPPGSARVLSSVYKESGTAMPMSWVGFYKSPDLDGQMLRHVLVAGGTILHRIDSGALTALTGSGKNITEARTSGNFHTADQYADFLLIQNQNPDLAGDGDTPVKYDGADIHRWGVLAPGTEETTREAFSSASSFTATGGTATDETTTTQDGAAVKFTKTSTALTVTHVEKTVTSFSVNTTIEDRAAIYLYIPRGQISNFASENAVQVLVGSDANLNDNYYRFDFDIGVLTEGWNLLYLDFSDPDGTEGSPDSDALIRARFSTTSGAASTLISNLRWDRFITFDTGAPTTAEGAAGAVFASTDVYSYRVTYGSKYGHESNASPLSVDLTTSGALASIELSSIPVSSDPQIIKRHIYRTVADGSIHLFVATINDNVTTTYSDTTEDTGLGQTSPPIAGDISLDHSPPEKAGIVKRWKQTVFLAGFPEDPTAVDFSEYDKPEAFPLLNRVNLDGKVTAIYESWYGLVIETENGKWSVQAENPDFKFDKAVFGIGCVGPRAAGTSKMWGYSADRDGFWFYNMTDPYKVSEPWRDIYDAFDKSNIELIHTVSARNRNALLLFAPDSNGDYKDDNYVFQYRDITPDEILKGWWWRLRLPSSVNIQDTEEVEDSNGSRRLYAGGDDGMVYELFKSGEKNWVDANGTVSAITTTAQTKWYRLGVESDSGEACTGRVSPRMIEVRHKGDATTWTLTVDTANAPDQPTPTATETITIPLASGEYLLRYPIPAMQPGEFIRIKLVNSDASVSSTVVGVKLYYSVLPGQFPIQTGEMS